MRNYVDFTYLDEARYEAGFFISKACDELGITERTWFRWKAANRAPRWAYRYMSFLSGDLAPLGWKHWHIKRGKLYEKTLNSRYYSWTPADLLVPIFCPSTWQTDEKIHQHEFLKSEAGQALLQNLLNGANAQGNGAGVTGECRSPNDEPALQPLAGQPAAKRPTERGR